MVNIAILEDEESAARTLQAILNTFAQENSVTFGIKHFSDAVSFLTDYKKIFDIVFVDIELSGTNGMDAAYKLREFDKQVIIIFVTNMAQYAVKGYEVGALYYIIKPVNYQGVAHKLKRALSIISANTDAEIVLPQTNGIVRLSTKDLTYIEIISHKLIYHTDSGAFTTYGSLSEVEKKLKVNNFLRCNSCYLVNAKHIASVAGYTITLYSGERIQISRPKKRQFMLDLANWLGEGNV